MSYIQLIFTNNSTTGILIGLTKLNILKAQSNTLPNILKKVISFSHIYTF